MFKVSGILKDFFNLLIPSKCANCGINLHEYEHYICKECLHKIPKTNFYKDPANLVSQVFWGRVNLEHAFAHYYFSKGSILQGLVHQIKYKGVKELAYELGKEIGYDLKKNRFQERVDLIVPVPLHPAKEKKRTYNQSDWIARGIADVLGTPYNKHTLNRVLYTSTQTKKNRQERWENVKNAFEVADIDSIRKKHVLLVDDVLTTGATLEACASKILEGDNTKASIVTLGFASD